MPDTVRSHYGLEPFYTKHIDAVGVPVLSSGEVDDRALQEACAIIAMMLSKRPDIAELLFHNKVRVGIIGRNQVTTDMPEYRTLPNDFPGIDYDSQRFRGLGATLARPLSSVGEENLLGFPRGDLPDGDPFAGESIMVHEFAHTVLEVGLFFAPDNPKNGPSTEITNNGRMLMDEIVMLHGRPEAQNIWVDTFAITTWNEYWAEGVQTWFETNLTAEPPNGIHGPIDTRAELRMMDPDLAMLISRFFIERDFDEL